MIQLTLQGFWKACESNPKFTDLGCQFLGLIIDVPSNDITNITTLYPKELLFISRN